MILSLEIDDDVEDHIGRHGVTAGELIEVLANLHLTYPNPDEGEDRMYLIGVTSSGRPLKASLAPTADPGTWRPVTAFPATPDDIKLLNKYVQ
jgi:hypothetical protein